MNTRQQSESQRPCRRVRRVISSSDDEAAETSTPQAKPVKKETEQRKKVIRKKKKVPILSHKLCSNIVVLNQNEIENS